MMSAGYLDGVNNTYWSNGSQKRPFEFNFNCFGGESDQYTSEMMNVDKMSDDELFCSSRTDR